MTKDNVIKELDAYRSKCENSRGIGAVDILIKETITICNKAITMIQDGKVDVIKGIYKNKINNPQDEFDKNMVPYYTKIIEILNKLD